MQWVDDLFNEDENHVTLDWKTQSLLIRMLDESVLKHDTELRSEIIRGEFTRDSLDKLFAKLIQHRQQLPSNPSQTDISYFIKNYLL